MQGCSIERKEVGAGDDQEVQARWPCVCRQWAQAPESRAESFPGLMKDTRFQEKDACVNPKRDKQTHSNCTRVKPRHTVEIQNAPEPS